MVKLVNFVTSYNSSIQSGTSLYKHPFELVDEILASFYDRAPDETYQALQAYFDKFHGSALILACKIGAQMLTSRIVER
jgi:hypothetical protein